MEDSEKKRNFANVLELERHIETLLLCNDCVIVPGLGGFMTNHVSARYDHSDHTFLPPMRTLGFNPKLHLNDSLLALSYIEAYDLSYPDAIHRIEDEVSELKQHIRNNGSYELNGIGELVFNEEGNIEFHPCESGILTPSFYALSSFEMEELIPQAKLQTQPLKERKPATPTILPSQVLEKNIEKETSDSPSKDEEDTFEQETEEEIEEEGTAKTVCIKLSLLKHIAVAAIILFGFFIFTTPLGNSTQQAASIDSGMLKKMMPKETTLGGEEIKKAVVEKKIAVQPKVAEDEKVTKEEPNSEIAHDYYTLVLASHVTKANAQSYVTQLAKQGVEAKVIIQKSVKVISGEYKSENEAYNQLNSLRDKEAFKEAWVLRIQQ